MQFLHGWPRYLYVYRSGIFPEMPKDAKPYPTLNGYLVWKLLISRKPEKHWKKSSGKNLVNGGMWVPGDESIGCASRI
jgi:hypothetical protein